MDFSYLKTAFPFLAGLGAIGLAWNQIKGALSRIFSFIINTIKLKDFAAGAVSTFIWQNCKGIDTGTYNYHANAWLTKYHPNSILIGSKRLSDKYQLFFYGWVPLLAKYHDNEERFVTVLFVRKTLDFDKLFLQAIENWNYLVSNNKNRFRVETFTGRDRNLSLQINKSDNAAPVSVGGGGNVLSLDTLHWLTGRMLKYTYDDLGKDYQSFLKSYVLDENLESVYNEVEAWIRLKDWYQSKGLIWRRGYLLYGKAGTGKTSCVRVIGTKFNLPIFRFDLSSMTNNDLIESWNKIVAESPCIALLEDIDAVFNKRENVSKLKNGLSFDCLLNVISGAMPVEGVLLFVTTNKIETLDSALANIEDVGASRPGRIDRIVEVVNLSLVKKRELAEKILEEFPENIEEVMDGAVNLSNAQFTERCSQVALKKLWKNK